MPLFKTEPKDNKLQLFKTEAATLFAYLQAADKYGLFAMFEAKSQSFRSRLISVFSGCVHFVIQRPGTESV